MIQLDTIQLKRLLQDAAEAGAQKALESLAPTESELTQNEVMRWMKRLGKPASIVKKMKQEKLIHGVSRTGSANSTIYYKKSEVHQAMQALNLFPIINS